MNTLTTWEMDELQTRLAGFFGLPFFRPANAAGEAMAFVEWTPSVDISEDEKEWCLKADLPDVKKEDVSVTVENGVLRLAGERKIENVQRGRMYYCMECACGKFVRSFPLPERADGSRAAAEHKGGVLTVRIPKNERIKPKAPGTTTG